MSIIAVSFQFNFITEALRVITGMKMVKRNIKSCSNDRLQVSRDLQKNASQTRSYYISHTEVLNFREIGNMNKCLVCDYSVSFD